MFVSFKAQGGTDRMSPVEAIIPRSTVRAVRPIVAAAALVSMGTNQEEPTQSAFVQYEPPSSQARGILITVGSKDGKGAQQCEYLSSFTEFVNEME